MPSPLKEQHKMDSRENPGDDDDTMIGRIVLTPCLRFKQKAGMDGDRFTTPTRRSKPTTKSDTSNRRGISISNRHAHPLEGRDDDDDDDEGEEETIYFYTATSSSTSSSDDSERENDSHEKVGDSYPNPNRTKKVMFDENHKEFTYYTDDEEEQRNTTNNRVGIEKSEHHQQEPKKPQHNCCCSGIAYLLGNLFTRYWETTTNNNEVRIDPNLYLQATGEIWVSILIICWFLIAINNPDSITTDNPYLDRLGYINLWIGWDLALLLSPSEEGGTISSVLTALGLVGWIVCTSCGMRFCYLDTIRTALLHSHRNNRVQYVIKRTFHGLFTMSLCSKMWFLSITSVFHTDLIQDNNDVDIRKIVWSTTCMNMGLMFTWYLIVMSTYLEHHKEYQDQTKCKIFLIVFGICSFAVPPLILYQYFVYDFRYHPSSQTILPIHPGLLAPLDYLWYVCMLLTNRFLLPKENHRLILIQSYSLIQKEPVTASSTTSTTAETNTLSTTTAAEF